MPRHATTRHLVLFALLVTSALASTPTEKVIYTFQGGNDGAAPTSDLIADKNGNLYGTTSNGGAGQCADSGGIIIGCGTVFELVKPAQSGGKWKEVILHSFLGDFCCNPLDSGFPLAGLVIDAAGNLYGTTSGNTDPIEYQDYGTVFELTPPSTVGGSWTETILYAFKGGYDGGNPRGVLVFDNKGNLYGSTTAGAPFNAGTIFRLAPPTTTGGAWTETVLYQFFGGDDGQNPAGVILDAKNNIYGTTAAGGGFSVGGDQYTDYWAGGGTFFQLTPPSKSGKPWNETLPYAFPPCVGNSFDGFYDCGTSTQPMGKLVFDASGNLYGTTELGGYLNYNACASKEIYLYGCGTVFQFVPPTTSGGAWTQNILWEFTSTSNTDGAFPMGDLSLDSPGNLYGTTANGCATFVCAPGSGTVFELSPPSTQGGSWTENILYQFQGGADGSTPVAGVLIRGTVLYTTTQYGGSGNCPHTESQPTGCGTVVEILN